MKKRRVNLPLEVHEVVKNTSKAYLLTAADMTPVDTSAAVSNWRVGIDSAPSGWIAPHVPGKFRSTALESFNATIGIGFGIIESSLPGNEIHIVNNIPYIGDLNDGTSTQAPKGMTDTAELVARRIPQMAQVVKPK